MPSCVVKSCKNHSCTCKKNQGITFHKFPSANDPWKNDWVQIIRESRKEDNWNPSKYSVVCSAHFEESDLYATKSGLLRVVTYAVPKRFLHETSSNQVEQYEASTSSALHEISSETLKISEQFPDENTSIASHVDPLETSNIKIEESAGADIFSDEDSLESLQIKIEKSAEAFNFSDSHEDPLESLNIKIEDSAEANTSSALNEDPLETLNIKIEESSESNSSSDSHEYLMEVSDTRMEKSAESNSSSDSLQYLMEVSDTRMEESTESNSSSDSLQFPMEISDTKIEETAKPNISSDSHKSVAVEDGLTLQRSFRELLTPSRQETFYRLFKTVPRPLEILTAEQLLALENYEKQRIKERLMKMYTCVLSQKKRIKTLNQTVRLLENRKKSLKALIKSVKEEI